MQSTMTPQETDPHDAFVIEPDVVLATRQASPDPVQEFLSHLAHKAARGRPRFPPPFRRRWSKRQRSIRQPSTPRFAPRHR